jgi:hypothetical protein
VKRFFDTNIVVYAFLDIDKLVNPFLESAPP